MNEKSKSSRSGRTNGRKARHDSTERTRIVMDEIYKLRNEETTAANLCAITNATGKIMSAEVLKLKYAELTGLKPQSKMLGSEMVIEQK